MSDTETFSTKVYSKYLHKARDLLNSLQKEQDLSEYCMLVDWSIVSLDYSFSTILLLCFVLVAKKNKSKNARENKSQNAHTSYAGKEKSTLLDAGEKYDGKDMRTVTRNILSKIKEERRKFTENPSGYESNGGRILLHC